MRRKMLVASCHILWLLTVLSRTDGVRAAQCRFQYLQQPPSTPVSNCNPYSSTQSISIALECLVRRVAGVVDAYEIRWFRENASGVVEPLGFGLPELGSGRELASRYHNNKFLHQPYNPSFLGKYWCQVINTTADPEQPLMRSNVFTLLAPENYTGSTCYWANAVQTIHNKSCADLPEPLPTAIKQSPSPTANNDLVITLLPYSTSLRQSQSTELGKASLATTRTSPSPVGYSTSVLPTTLQLTSITSSTSSALQYHTTTSINSLISTSLTHSDLPKSITMTAYKTATVIPSSFELEQPTTTSASSLTTKPLTSTTTSNSSSVPQQHPRTSSHEASLLPTSSKALTTLTNTVVSPPNTSPTLSLKPSATPTTTLVERTHVAEPTQSPLSSSLQSSTYGMESILTDTDYSRTVSPPTSSVEVNRQGSQLSTPYFVVVLAIAVLLLVLSVTGITMVIVMVSRRCKAKQPIQSIEVPKRGYVSSSSDTIEKKHQYEEEPYYSSAYFTTSPTVSSPVFLVYSEVTKPSRISGYYQELNSTDYASVYATIIRSGRERPPSPQETIYSVPQ